MRLLACLVVLAGCSGSVVPAEKLGDRIEPATLPELSTARGAADLEPLMDPELRRLRFEVDQSPDEFDRRGEDR